MFILWKCLHAEQMWCCLPETHTLDGRREIKNNWISKDHFRMIEGPMIILELE